MKNGKKYHKNFKAQALHCKMEAHWTCQECGLYVGSTGIEVVNTKTGVCWVMKIDAAHMDHDPENPFPRIKAMCHLCHMAYDNAPEQRQRRRALEQQMWLHQSLISEAMAIA